MCEGDPDHLLWEQLKSEPPTKEVQRVNLNRYFSTPRNAEGGGEPLAPDFDGERVHRH